MPNRKTFDPREKYDHSGRPIEHPAPNDLKPDVSEEGRRPAERDKLDPRQVPDGRPGQPDPRDR